MKESIILNQNWKYLEKTYSWVADMQYVIQDPIHHAEGNVAVHTQMVLASLLQSEEYAEMNDLEKEITWMAALLHDVEKRSTTVKEDGSITSRNHARKGEFSARQILYKEIPTEFFVREHIAALVRYHGLPLWIMEKQNPQRSLAEASLRLNTRLLYALAKADVLGRICKDKDQLLEKMEFFKAYCIEQNCWGQPRLFKNNYAKFHYFNNEHSSIDYVPYDDSTCEIVMLSGLPGMGKDHYIQNNYPKYPVISLDDIRRKHKLSPVDKSATGRVVQEAKEQAREYLRKAKPFVWNATNITSLMRAQLIELFITYKAKVKIVYLEVPYNKWLRQNNEREYALPEQVLHKMLTKLEVPVVFEANEVEYVVKS